jgi:glutamyl/glutaminyl-tRNA synthetase
LAPDRSKLSKRHGATSITEYRKKGFLPEAMVNYLALLGWNPGTDQELFSLKELTQIFELERVQKGGAVFNIEKLEWLNQQYLRKLPEKAFSEEFMAALPERVTRMPEFSKERVNRMLPLIRERIHTFADVSAMAEEGEFDYYFSYPDYQTADLLWKGSTDLAATKRRLEHVYSLLGRISDNDFVFSEKIKAALWEYASAEGRGEVLWPTRYALSGKKQSPDPFIIASVIGKGPTLARLKTAIEKITSSSSRHDPS